MPKGKNEKRDDGQPIEATLLSLVKPKELLREARKAHPEASKRDIVRAAFRTVIAAADCDAEKAVLLQDFAIKNRADD
ncbi:MAG TPA: hypothetical protein VGU19_13635 [Microvirga sp.]|jgi:hypothetical protein|nr:hypothetical protein [Microvirga sp.]